MKQEIFKIDSHELTVEIADSFLSRLRGLMFCDKLEDGHGLLIIPCNSVHMMFMRFVIDVVYLNKDFEIIKIVYNLRPWLGLSICFDAHSTLELKSGEARRLNLKIGQKLCRS